MGSEFHGMRRLRFYFGLFGVPGTWIMLGTLGQIEFFARSMGKFAVVGTPLLWVGHLSQTLVCLGYVYMAWKLPVLLQGGSLLPQRLVQSSMAIAAMVACLRMAFSPWTAIALLLLPLLLNMAFNVPLLKMVKEAAERSRSESRPGL